MIRTASIHRALGALRPCLPASFARTAAATLLCASAAMADHTVVGFDGPNVGGWSFGLPSIIQPSGGNPGAWLNGVVDTFAPQLHTTIDSAFHGNWRANKIATIGVDLITNSTQFPAERPLSLILSNGDCQIYFVGAKLVPQPGAGWKSFTFQVPSQSLTMPAGWAILGASSCTDPDGAWNSVMLNVTEARFFYGDPTNFFIFDIWNVGADNVRIYPDAFTTLNAGALAGTFGVPKLLGTGTLEPLSPVRLNLTEGLPNGLATMVVGFSAINAPFKGGTLLPKPDVIFNGLPMNGVGALVLNAAFPVGIPGNLTFTFQVWFVDHGGLQGFAASNGVEAVTP